MTDNSDFKYEPPTKEFIENSLLYGLISENDTDPKIKTLEMITYDSQDLRSILNNKRGIEKWLIKVAYDNKKLIKKVPWLSNTALSMKRYLIKKSIRHVSTGAQRLDLSGIMNLEINDFIWQLYSQSLGRAPDDDGWKNTKYLLCSGASKEAVAYIICTSKEFANRAQVVNIDKYKRAHRSYLIRKGFRSLPIISYFWAIAAVPRRLSRLEIDERIRYVDSQLLERQRYDELTKEINLTVKNQASLSLELNALRQEIHSVLSENKLLKHSINELDEKINGIYKTELSINSNLNNLDAQISKFTAEYQTGILGIRESFADVNRYFLQADVKLGEIRAYTANLANQNKPMVYSLPGGITAVQTKEYIIGVPSEEWRLAVFLSKYGFFELGAEKYFRSIIKEGMNVLDVGAYLGIYTLHALAAGCTVYSYEPTPKIFDILTDNVRINGFEPTHRAHLFNYVVADKEGQAKYSVTGNGVGQMNSLYALNTDDSILDMKTISLDNHLANLDHVDLAKIDVEGAEPIVIKGMRGIIDRNPNLKIIMEFAPTNLRRGRVEPIDFIHDIRSMGLQIRLIHEETGEIIEIDDSALCAVFSVNVLLTKEK